MMSDDCTLKAKAICGAYLMVAFADGRYDPVEENRLLSTLINHPSMDHIDAGSLEDCYNALAAAFRKDYSKTAEDVLLAIADVRSAADTVETIAMAARLAIVADQKVLQQEEAILSKIAGALGLEKGSL